MGSIPPRLPKRNDAWGCLFANLAVPGLGTFVGGARITGLLQIILSQAGFGLALTWASSAVGLWFRTGALPLEPGRLFWLGLGGSLLFLGVLAWSLVSSLCLVQRASTTKW